MNFWSTKRCAKLSRKVGLNVPRVCPESRRCIAFISDASTLSSTPCPVSFSTLCPPATVRQLLAGTRAWGWTALPEAALPDCFSNHTSVNRALAQWDARAKRSAPVPHVTLTPTL